MSTTEKPALDYWQERTVLAEEAAMQLAQQLVKADPRLHQPLQSWASRWEELIGQLDQKHATKEQP